MNRLIKLFLFIGLFVLYSKVVSAAMPPNCTNGTVYDDRLTSNITQQQQDYKLICLTGETMAAYERFMGGSSVYILDDSWDSTTNKTNAIAVDFNSIPEFYNKFALGMDDYSLELAATGLNPEQVNQKLQRLLSTIDKFKDTSDTTVLPDKVCKYGAHTLTFNKQKRTISSTAPGPLYIYYDDLEAFNFECPPNLCVDNGVSLSGKDCAELNSTPNSSNGNNLHDDQANLPSPQVPTCETFKVFTDPIWFWLRIIGPTLALVLGVLDLLKAVASGDNKSVAKSYSDFGKRLGLAALLLLLPTVLNLLIGIVGFGDYTACF